MPAVEACMQHELWVLGTLSSVVNMRFACCFGLLQSFIVLGDQWLLSNLVPSLRLGVIMVRASQPQDDAVDLCRVRWAAREEGMVIPSRLMLETMPTQPSHSCEESQNSQTK